MKRFKNQTTLKVLLCKYIINEDIEFARVCFNSATKTVINSDKYGLDRSFQELLYRTDSWVSKKSVWIIVSIQSQYVNISIYSPLSGSSYIKLADRLSNPRKGMINVKNNDNKCFLGAISDT